MAEENRSRIELIRSLPQWTIKEEEINGVTYQCSNMELEDGNENGFDIIGKETTPGYIYALSLSDQQTIEDNGKSYEIYEILPRAWYTLDSTFNTDMYYKDGGNGVTYIFKGRNGNEPLELIKAKLRNVVRNINLDDIIEIVESGYFTPYLLSDEHLQQYIEHYLNEGEDDDEDNEDGSEDSPNNSDEEEDNRATRAQERMRRIQEEREQMFDREHSESKESEEKKETNEIGST
jgi:hypothetical protein